jgi:dTDP-4-amino-4,6-dideoxygalactose transaminase
MSPPDVGDLEAKYAVEAIHSGWVAPLGPQVDAFEREMCERVGVGHALALSSGTAALHLALLAWGVGPASRWWPPP